MRRFVSAVLVFAVAVLLSPASLAAQAQTGGISGTAATADGARIANAQVRIIDPSTGRTVATSVTRANGSFAVSGVNPGNYIVQIVGPNGAVVGTSAAVTVTAGAVASGVAITATAAALAAGGLSAVTIGAIIVGGAAVGVTALVVATNDSSPSR